MEDGKEQPEEPFFEVGGQELQLLDEAQGFQAGLAGELVVPGLEEEPVQARKELP